MKKILIKSTKILFLKILLIILFLISLLENDYLIKNTIDFMNKNFEYNVKYSSIEGGVFSGIEIKDLNYKEEIFGNFKIKIKIFPLFIRELRFSYINIDNFAVAKDLDYFKNIINNKKSSYLNINYINSVKINELSINKLNKNFYLDKEVYIDNIDIKFKQFELDLTDINNIKIDTEDFLINSNLFNLKSKFTINNKYFMIKNDIVFRKDMMNKFYKIENDKIKIDNEFIKITNKITKENDDYYLENNIEELKINYLNEKNDLNINILSKVNNKFEYISNNIDFTLNNILFNLKNNSKIILNKNMNYNVETKNSIKINNEYLLKLLEKNTEKIKLNFNIKPFDLYLNLNNQHIDLKTSIEADMNYLNYKDILYSDLNLNIENNNNYKLNAKLNNLNIDIPLKTDLEINGTINKLKEDFVYKINTVLGDVNYKNIFKELKIETPKELDDIILNNKNTIETKGDINKINNKINTEIVLKNKYLNIKPIINSEVNYEFNNKSYEIDSNFTNEEELFFNGTFQANNKEFRSEININKYFNIKEDFKLLEKDFPLKVNFFSKNYKNYLLNIKNKQNNSFVEFETNNFKEFDIKTIIDRTIIIPYFKELKPLDIKLNSISKLNVLNNVLDSKNTINLNNINISMNNYLENNILHSNIDVDNLLFSQNNFNIINKDFDNSMKVNIDNLNFYINKFFYNDYSVLNSIKGYLYLENKIKNFNEFNTLIKGDILTPYIDFNNLDLNLNSNLENKSIVSNNISFNLNRIDIADNVNEYFNKRYNFTNSNIILNKDNKVEFTSILNNNTNVKGELNKYIKVFFNTKNEKLLVKEYGEGTFNANGYYELESLTNHKFFADIDIINGNVLYDTKEFSIDKDKDIIIMRNKKDKKKILGEQYNIFKTEFDLDLNIKNINKIKYNKEKININNDFDLLVRKKYNEDIILNGKINNIEGFYSFLGKKFSIIDSNVLFNNDLEPLLNIKLEYKKDDITIYIYIKGSLSSPIISLTSSPIMSENDIYSYLLFNKSSEKLTDSDKYTNTSSDLSILFLSNTFTKEIAENLGIDNINVFMNNNIVGYEVEKSINDDLKIIYNQEEELNKVKLEYKINHNIGIETTYGDKKGLDLFYKKKYK